MKFPSKIHWHPFSVHFPSVFYPFAVFMLIVYLFSDNKDFEKISNYSLWAGTLTNLSAIVSGFVDWKNRYRSNLVPVFVQKIGISLFTFEISALCLCWHFVNPDILMSDNSLGTANVYKYIYIGLVLSLAPAIGYAGHLGGKLIHS
ncbi:MAG: DUF2231 domain-containing protein [Candidatus Anammoxibacter sp.]